MIDTILNRSHSAKQGGINLSLSCYPVKKDKQDNAKNILPPTFGTIFKYFDQP